MLAAVFAVRLDVCPAASFAGFSYVLWRVDRRAREICDRPDQYYLDKLGPPPD